MDNQPALDRSLLFPILIGGLSIVGIIVVLLIGRSLNSPPEPALTPSPTRFEYVFLGTEPAVTTPLTDESEIPLTEPPVEEEPDVITPALPSPTRPAVPTPGSQTTPSPVTTPTVGTPRTLTPTPLRLVTSTVTSGSPAAVNTYDDTDSRLAYSGSWVSQSGVSGAYQGTLHVSDTIGNFVTFTFTGLEIQLYYQAGTSLGTVTILFDNESLGIPLSQSGTSGVWVYTLSSPGTHTVVITHTSGGSVNIDRLVIPAPTVTPTRTPTATQ